MDNNNLCTCGENCTCREAGTECQNCVDGQCCNCLQDQNSPCACGGDCKCHQA